MTQANCRRHGNHITRKQREFHARLALCDTIAHGRNAARHLRCAARGPRRRLDEIRKALIGLMRREHIVEGGDNADIGGITRAYHSFIVRPAGGKTMREIGTTEIATFFLHFAGTFHPLKIGGAGGF